MGYHELLRYYRDVCAPAIDALESYCSAHSDDGEEILYRYPEIHNEVRMAFSHLSRAALSCDKGLLVECLIGDEPLSLSASIKEIDSASGAPFSSEEVEKEVEQASKHLRRVTMDALKCLYLNRIEEVEKALSEKENYSIEGVDNGTFFEKIQSIKSAAAKDFTAAKAAETVGMHSKAAELYRSADANVKRLEEYIASKAEPLERSKRNYYSDIKGLAPDLILLTVSLLVFVVSLMVGA